MQIKPAFSKTFVFAVHTMRFRKPPLWESFSKTSVFSCMRMKKRRCQHTQNHRYHSKPPSYRCCFYRLLIIDADFSHCQEKVLSILDLPTRQEFRHSSSNITNTTYLKCLVWGMSNSRIGCLSSRAYTVMS